MITINDIKLFLNDFADTNRLLHRPEFSPERIHNAVMNVLSEWNETPPILTQYKEDNFPYRLTMLYGVCSFLLAGEATYQARNQLTYQSGGLAVDDMNKADPYLRLSKEFEQKYKSLMATQKRQENIQRGWGHVSSGYYSS